MEIEQQTQLMNLIVAGKLPLVGTYLGSKTAAKQFTSQKTGKLMDMKIASHVVICGDEQNTRSVLVEEILDDKTDLATYAPPAKRGELVVVLVEQIKSDRGNLTARPEKGGILKLAA